MNIDDAYNIVAPLNYSDNPDNDIEVYYREQEIAQAAREVRYKEMLSDPECVLEAFQEIPHNDDFESVIRAGQSGDYISMAHLMNNMVLEYLWQQSEE